MLWGINFIVFNCSLGSWKKILKSVKPNDLCASLILLSYQPLLSFHFSLKACPNDYKTFSEMLEFMAHSVQTWGTTDSYIGSPDAMGTVKFFWGSLAEYYQGSGAGDTGHTHRGIAGLRVQVHFTWGRTGGESMPLLRVVL